MNNVTELNQVFDFDMEEHNSRQHEEINPEVILQKSAHIKQSDKFYYAQKEWFKKPYRGYAIVSMVNNNTGNRPLQNQLQEIQQELLDNFPQENILFPLPTNSYHQTIANTLSDHRFQKYVIDNKLEEEYPYIIQQAFDDVVLDKIVQPIEMKMAGLSIFGSAIGMLGIIKNEDDYKRITDFREFLYTNPELNQIDIKRTRPFIGHITLFYIGQNLDELQQERLATLINDINRKIEKASPTFFIHHAELRSYEELSCFEKRKGYPVFNFCEE